MSRIPIGLGPLMGYMLWQIQHGSTPEQARLSAEGNVNYQGFRPDEYLASMYEAAHNAAITERAQDRSRNVPIGTTTGEIVPADTVFGVRVILTHTDPSGLQSIASVVVNAAASASIDDIVRAAERYANSGALAQHTGHASPGLFAAGFSVDGEPRSAIGQVVRGGLPGAVIGVL
jgi:hypothetical protein